MTTTSILPLSNIINVSILNTPIGLTEPNVNSVMLLSTETPVNAQVTLNGYASYVSAQQVVTDWGTNSVTAAMANEIFSQSPNILSGNGVLTIAPMLSAVSATSGNFTTASLTANLATLIAVANGNLKVTIDGVINNLGTLNFTACVTLGDVATVLQNALPNAIVTLVGSTIVFTSKKVGTSSTIALAAYSGGGTDLTGSTYLNVSAGTATPGVNSSGETIASAVSRLLPQVFFAHVLSNLNIEDAVVVSTAAALASQDVLFYQHFASSADNAGVITTIQQATENKTRCLLYLVSQSAANLFKAAYVGRAVSVDFTGSNTDSTMQLKTLAGVLPDPYMTQTIYNAAKISGADLYVSFQGVPSCVSNGANDYFDNQYANLALKFALETAGFNYLATTNTKVPQTESGMNGLKNAYAQVMAQFVTNGELAPGQWNSSLTFGDPVKFTNNITQKGYYIYSLPVAQQSVSARNARTAPLVQIAAKRAGAIQNSSVTVIVNA